MAKDALVQVDNFTKKIALSTPKAVENMTNALADQLSNVKEKVHKLATDPMPSTSSKKWTTVTIIMIVVVIIKSLYKVFFILREL